MIGIVDYGMGNLLSVSNAFESLNADVRFCRQPQDFESVERIVLPGVGAFRECIGNLRNAGLVEALEEAVLSQRKPILGICLGMQVMARRSFEGGEYCGLGWIDADVVRLEPSDTTLRVPHIGWNEVQYRSASPFFASLAPTPEFYFAHSYHLKCADEAEVEATCDYGLPVTAAVRKNNIFATQFHPEKSQDNGISLLEKFCRWQP